MCVINKTVHLVAVSDCGSRVDEPWHDPLFLDLGEEGQRGPHDPVGSVSCLDEAEAGRGVRVDATKAGGDGRAAKVAVKVAYEILKN
jgi:hypothetical protein